MILRFNSATCGSKIVVPSVAPKWSWSRPLQSVIVLPSSLMESIVTTSVCVAASAAVVPSTSS